MSEKKNIWLESTDQQKQDIMTTADGYMDYLSKCKTERLAVKESISLAKQYGYEDINTYIKENKPLNAGAKVYYNMNEKALALFHVGTKPLAEGLNILGAHIDSPRLDLKQHPIYEKDGICLLDTHYYGGIKAYQWVTIPLSLFGVVYLKDGRQVEIAIGDQEDDEVFVITDLLIHLSGERMTRKANEVIEGESLDVTFGSIPQKDEKKDPVKANILSLLKSRYDIEEDDFISAELELVPSGKARTCGFDHSMILGYGQDDRICAYTSLLAMLNTAQEEVERTSACLLVDKEEVGSIGATGMQSYFFENVVAELMNLLGQYNELNVRRALQNSYMLSCDVSAAHDPNYAEASSPNNNAAEFGYGVCLSKYVGSRGKSGSNDANAEYISKLRIMANDANVIWQTGELGKVNQGGGGTIAYILAKYGMQVIDCGVALMNMHAPFELSSKADVYSALKFNEAFLRAMK